MTHRFLKRSLAPLITALLLLLMAAASQAQGALSFSLTDPRDAVVDHLDVLYVSEGSVIRRFSLRTQNELTPIALPGALALGMAFDPGGCRLAIADGALGTDRVWVLDDIGDRTARSVALGALPFGRFGTFSVAWSGAGSNLLASGRYNGSGWSPLRRVDVDTGAVTLLTELRQDSMLAVSANHSLLALTEHNISSGPVRLFSPDGAVPLSTRNSSWFQWEVAISPDASVVVAPTYNGAYIYDINAQSQLIERPTRIGVYANWGPVGFVFARHTQASFAAIGAFSSLERRVVAFTDYSFQSPIVLGMPPISLTGNHAYQQGRTQLSADGRWLSVTLDASVMVYPVGDLAAKPGRIFSDGHECGDSVF